MNKQNFIEGVQQFISEHSEENYQVFSSKLLPGVDNIIGVRIPKMHKFTNQLIKNGINISIFSEFNDGSFEEIMIEGMLIAKGDWTRPQRKKLIKTFVPKIKNWSHCDTFCKFIIDVDKTYLTMIRNYSLTKSEYKQRFAMVMLLEHFIDKNHMDDIFNIIENMQPNGYYSQMSIAWLLAMMYSEFPDDVYNYLINSSLDVWTKNKSIQKMCESLKTNDSQRKLLQDTKKLWT